MKSDFLLQAVAILMGALGFMVTLYPPSKLRWKVVWCLSFAALCVAEVGLALKQSNEAESERNKAEQHQSLTQDLQAKNSALRDQVLVLQSQNRDLDAQLVAIRKKFGVSAQFDRGISVDVRTKFGAEATVEKGPGHAAPEGR